MDLKTFQDEVLQAIVPAVSSQETAGFSALSALPGVPLARAIEVYRTNARAVLQRALEEAYPATAKLIARNHFTAVCDNYALAKVGGERDLNAYGCDFASFLGKTRNDLRTPFLVDLARLEWAMHRAFYAVDDEPAATREIAKFLYENGDDARLSLRASAILFESRWRVSEIKEMIEKNRSVSGDISAVGYPERFFVYKHEFIVHLSGVEDELWPLLVAIAKGQLLGSIARQFELNGTPNLLAEALSVAARRGWIAAKPTVTVQLA